MRVKANAMCFVEGARRREGEEFDVKGKCPKCCTEVSVKEATEKKPGKKPKEPETFTELGDGIM